MKNIISLLFLSIWLTACGGGSSGDTGSTGGGSTSTGSTIPVGVVSGVAFDGLLINSTVNVYDFTSGVKGSLLATTTTNAAGAYSLSLQVESRPVLLEVTGGYYFEESGPGFQVSLASHTLTAVTQYTTGTPLAVHVTALTHFAAGLASYQIKHGTSVASALTTSNARISAFAGFDILTTTPKSITNSANQSASLTPELKYGFLEAAISMWAYTHAPSVQLAQASPYTSIDFIQQLYKDISADGVLDGKGLDSGGAVTALSFGVVPLNTESYRFDLSLAMLQLANEANNKTGISSATLLAYAQTYASGTDAVFNNVAPSAIAAPAVTLTSPASGNVLNHNITVTANAQAIAGFASVELLVDGNQVATAANPASPSIPLATAGFTDGSHVLMVRATDIVGRVATSSATVVFNNTAPTINIAAPTAGLLVAGTTTVSATTASVAGLTRVELLVDGASIADAVSLTSPTFQLNTLTYADGAHTIGIRTTDVGSQTALSTVQVIVANAAPVVALSTPANNSWARRSISIASNITNGAPLTAIDTIVDGVVVSTGTVSPSNYVLNTTSLADGVHTVGVRATDSLGHITTSTVSIKVDNTAPSSTATYSGQAGGMINLNGTALDNYAGVAGATVLYSTNLQGTIGTPTTSAGTVAANGVWSHTALSLWFTSACGGIVCYGPNPTTYQYRITDIAGNCSDYSMTVDHNGAPTALVLVNANACP